MIKSSLQEQFSAGGAALVSASIFGGGADAEIRGTHAPSRAAFGAPAKGARWVTKRSAIRKFASAEAPTPARGVRALPGSSSPDLF